MKAFNICVVFGLLLAGSQARPQLDDAEARRRALDGQDIFDPNPVYTYAYQVAADDQQTYISHTESRDGPQVDGEYSYVDPNGALVTVTYTANADDGYSETRSVQDNFVQIRAKPVVVPVVVEPEPVPTTSNSDLVARIISQLTPFIKKTVSSTLADQQAAAASETVITRVAPEATLFGDGTNNINVKTPSYDFFTTF